MAMQMMMIITSQWQTGCLSSAKGSSSRLSLPTLKLANIKAASKYAIVRCC